MNNELHIGTDENNWNYLSSWLRILLRLAESFLLESLGQMVCSYAGGVNFNIMQTKSLDKVTTKIQ